MGRLAKGKEDHIYWMADCYDLAKRFPNKHSWLALLEKVDQEDHDLNPFHIWLWLEIWKAAQESQHNCA
jgi:hypothetical protein